MNLALTVTNLDAVNQIYNTAFGERTTLNQLVGYLKEFLGEFDGEIRNIEILHGPNRVGDILILWQALTRRNRYWGTPRNTA